MGIDIKTYWIKEMLPKYVAVLHLSPQEIIRLAEQNCGAIASKRVIYSDNLGRTQPKVEIRLITGEVLRFYAYEKYRSKAIRPGAQEYELG